VVAAATTVRLTAAGRMGAVGCPADVVIPRHRTARVDRTAGAATRCHHTARAEAIMAARVDLVRTVAIVNLK